MGFNSRPPSYQIPSLHNIYEDFQRECNSSYRDVTVTDGRSFTRELHQHHHQHHQEHQRALFHSSATSCNRIADNRNMSNGNSVCSADHGVRRCMTLHIPEYNMLQDSSRVVGGVTGVLSPPPGIRTGKTRLLRKPSSSSAVDSPILPNLNLIDIQNTKSYPPPPPPPENRVSAHTFAPSHLNKIDGAAKSTSSSSVTSASASACPTRPEPLTPSVSPVCVTQPTNNSASMSHLSAREFKPPPPRFTSKRCKFAPPPRIKNNGSCELNLNSRTRTAALPSLHPNDTAVSSPESSRTIPGPNCTLRNQELLKKSQMYPPPPKGLRPTRGRAVDDDTLAPASTRAHPEARKGTSPTKSRRRNQENSSDEENIQISSTLSNEQSNTSVPPEAAPARREKLGCRRGYKLGETLRSPSHATTAGTDTAGSMSDNDFAFVKRCDGSFSYAILAFRSEEYDPVDRSLEESMTFVLSNSGRTKTIKKSQWGKWVRLVSKTMV